MTNKLLLLRIKNYEINLKNYIIDNIIFQFDIPIQNNLIENPDKIGIIKALSNSLSGKITYNIQEKKKNQKYYKKLKKLIRYFIDDRSLFYTFFEKYIINRPTNKIIEKIKKLQEDIKEYKHNLIDQNMHLVYSIAVNYSHGKNLNKTDIIQEGIFGLIKAINMIDISRDIELSTYSYYWIKYYMSMALYKQSNLIRTPINILKDLNKIKKMTLNFMKEHGYMPDNKELKKLTGFTENKLDKLKKYDNQILLDSCINTDDSLFLYLRDMADEENFIKKEDRKKIINNIKKLENEEKYLISKKFKLDYIECEYIPVPTVKRKEIFDTAIRKLQEIWV